MTSANPKQSEVDPNRTDLSSVKEEASTSRKNQSISLRKQWDLIGEDHSRFKKYAIISFGCLVFGAFLPLPLFIEIDNENHRNFHNAFINALSQILVGTSASALAASLIEIIAGMREAREREEKKRVFMSFFGNNPESSKVAIVMPRFSSKLIPGINNTEDNSYAKMMISCDDTFLSYADTQAATNIELLFRDFGLERPEIKYSDDDKLNLDNYKTVFFIGLFSNKLFIDKFRKHTLFRLEPASSNGSTNTQEPISSFRIAGRIDGAEIPAAESVKQFLDTEDSMYGLLARFKRNSTTIFMVGGVNALLTEKCGSYLVKEWNKDMGEHQDRTNKPAKKIENNDFALCIRWNPREASEDPEIHEIFIR